ncbi:uncharacterized protein P884DRAFT_216744 [Thermothelomyces heterothallicus CBS 202.75]|uniref:uncharacterized protein n=1 Tax=Thermothelomyces heterothallicus CBS 202.75 TaxID=1149848 RepID=UPI0037449F2D
MNSDSHSQNHRNSRNSHSFNSEEHVEQPRTHLQPSPDVRLGQDSPSTVDPSARHLQTQTTHQTAAPYNQSFPAILPDDIFTPATVARSYGPPVIIEGPYRRVPEIPPLAPYERSDWSTSMNPAMATDFRDELARLDGVITPGVDNTPFIHYAIEALSRDRDTGFSAANSGSQSSSSGPAFAPPPPGHGPQGHGPQSYQPQPPPQQQPPPASDPLLSPPPEAHPHAETAPPDTRPQPLTRPFMPGPQESAHSLAESLLKKGSRPAQPHAWRPVEQDELLVTGSHVPLPTFRPWPLRTPALLVFMLLCLLMIAALILSAVYSQLHQGLLEWDSLYGGRYFLFRIFPQLIAAPMLLYAQYMVTTMSRMIPFVRLASKSAEEREGALFQELYPSFLWPRLAGPWNVWVPVFVTWLANFTIPLQSSLFTVILVERRWVWATVQGVAWTLVALYLALLASTAIAWRYWSGLESTGVIWDPRSVADIAALVSETNTADDYRGTQLARSRDGIRFALRRRTTDRLCYWTWKDGRHGLWYALGNPMEDADPLLPIPDPATAQRMQRHDEKHPDHHPYHNHDPEASNGASRHQYEYLPLPLRTSPLLWATITATVLVIAIFVVTFLPSTRLEKGFPPRLRTGPRGGAFSPADFLFAFLPSLLGTLVFLAYRIFDKHLRILQPWAAMSSLSSSSSTTTTNPPFGGAPAEASVLADYAACAPGQATARALRNGHWRVAGVSLLADLFVLIPVLAGGSFMAVTPRGRAGAGEEEGGWGEVRMFANQVAYGILLGLLALYVAGLAVLLPARQAFRMPHGVTCLAEIVGYLVNSEIREEPAFKRCVSRREMAGKLGAGGDAPAGMQTRWVFGFGDGDGDGDGGVGNGELGVRRVRRFTEKRRVRKSQIRRPFL